MYGKYFIQSLLSIGFLFLLIQQLKAQDFRTVKWLDSKLVVKEKEKAIFMEESARNNYLEELHFVEFDSGYALHLFYVFRKDQLVGVKTQKQRLTGSNSKYEALEEYHQTYETYLAEYGEELIVEKPASEQAIKIMELKLTDREVFVTVDKIGNEYFLVENVFKKESKH